MLIQINFHNDLSDLYIINRSIFKLNLAVKVNRLPNDIHDWFCKQICIGSAGYVLRCKTTKNKRKIHDMCNKSKLVHCMYIRCKQQNNTSVTKKTVIPKIRQQNEPCMAFDTLANLCKERNGYLPATIRQ